MNAHQIVGEVVHQLVQENSHINFSIIQDRLVKEFMKVSKPGCDMEKAQAYEQAMKMFAIDTYNPKI